MAKYRVLLEVEMSTNDDLLAAQWTINGMMKTAMFQGSIQNFDIIDVDQIGE